MDIGAAFIPHGQAREAVEPGQRALDHSALLSQPLAGVAAFAGDADLDPTLGEGLATARDVVGLVRMQFRGALAPLAGRGRDRRHRVEHVREDHRVVAVRPRQEAREGDAASLDHKMALRARFAAIRRVRPDALAPLFAGMLALSRLARLQSMRSASPKRFDKSSRPVRKVLQRLISAWVRHPDHPVPGPRLL